MKRALKFIFTLLFMITLQPAIAEQPQQSDRSMKLKQGNRLPAFSFKDQFEELHSVPDKIRFLVFISDMDAGDKVHELFQSQGQKKLDELGIFCIADIHRMPALISRLFAIPAMRDYSYSLHLIRDEERGKIFPSEKGKITVIQVGEERTIQSLKLLNSTEELKDYLGL
jgi:hypothetical protein